MERVGKYELVQKIATGGMAEVFLAKTEGPGGFAKKLVVKRILPHLVEEPQFVEMFLGEAKLAALLNHQNVVQIFDFGEADGAYFIAMELIDGTNLRTLSKRAEELGRPIPFPLCAKITSLACEGLAYAHELKDPETGAPLNLVHRDISPDNIMVTRSGGVKVVDFGIAKAATQTNKTGTGVLKGKLAYMSPEQIASKPLDKRADVYAMGVVLYNLVTGTKPYDAESEVSLMHAILLEPPIRVRVRRPEVPEVLARIVERAMERDFNKRYQSCLELAADLEKYLRNCDAPAGSPEIAAFVTEVAPPSPGSGPGTPVGSRPRSSGGKVAPAPAPPPEPALEPEPAGTKAFKPTPKPAPEPEPEPARAPPRRGIPPIAIAMGGAVLVIGAGVVLFTRGKSPEPTPAPPPAVVEHREPAAPPPPAEPTPTPPPEPPAAPAAQPARVTIRSTPPGALRVNGKAVGKTPMQLDDLTAGPVTVEVSGPDFSKEQTFTLTPGDNGTKSIVIGRGTIQFRVQPYAIVTLDDQELGSTPLPPVKVFEGEHRVRFSNPTLHKTVTREVRVRAGENKLVALTME